MNNFKNILLATTLSFAALTSPAQAQTTAVSGDEEAALRAAALASVEAFHQGGMDGMAQAVDHCYASTAARRDPEPCIGMDMAASYIDLGTAQLNHSGTDARFSHYAVLTRVGTALRRAGDAETPEGAYRYVDARWDAIYQGTEDAATRVYPTATGPELHITSHREPMRVSDRG